MRFNSFAFAAVAFFLLNLVDVVVPSGFGLFYFGFGMVFFVLWLVREAQTKPPNSAIP